MATKKQPTIQDLMNKIDEVYAEVLKIKQSKAEARASKVFAPKVDDKCFAWSYVYHQVNQCKWDNSQTDIVLMERGEIFPTKELAEAALNKRLATVRVLNKLRELEGDWDSSKLKRKDCKVSVTYNCEFDYFHLLIDETVNYYTPKEWYSTEEAWQWVIDNMADDLKLAWGV